MKIKVGITFNLVNDSTYIVIDQVTDTNNYNYTIETSEGDHYSEFGGTIFNHEGTYLELVEKILHGRNMS